MLSDHTRVEFRVEKERVDAVITLSNGDSTAGHFFVARASPHSVGRERVAELLNAEPGFFPFEVQDGSRTRTVLYNRRQVVMVVLDDREARREPGHSVATERVASMLLSNGHRIAGSVRIYRPEGWDRLSDWARNRDMFRYVEAGDTTLLVNIAHVIEISEVPRP